MIKIFTYMLTVLITMNAAQAKTLTVATFNVSMEYLNYTKNEQTSPTLPPANVLMHALKNNNQQIKNIAEIIQRVNPDILLLNEFDNDNNTLANQHNALNIFMRNYLNKSQQGQPAVNYPYFYQGTVNTGINSGLDLDGSGKKGELPGDGLGYGHFPGHYGMVILSKYPIHNKQVRSFQHFKWHDMPNALKPITPSNNKPWFSDDAWQTLPLSSKSHWDIPIEINGNLIHILASHPTPPVFDGEENRNGNRNHDEIRFWADYIEPEKSAYIYDDNKEKGGLKPQQPFIILGDLNASITDGDAVKKGIASLLNHPKIQDPLPKSTGGKEHLLNNKNAQYHTAHWGMRADYVLPSKLGFTIQSSGVFWPTKTDKSYTLIQSRSASSDHRMVWVTLNVL